MATVNRTHSALSHVELIANHDWSTASAKDLLLNKLATTHPSIANLAVRFLCPNGHDFSDLDLTIISNWLGNRESIAVVDKRNSSEGAAGSLIFCFCCQSDSCGG